MFGPERPERSSSVTQPYQELDELAQEEWLAPQTKADVLCQPIAACLGRQQLGRWSCRQGGSDCDGQGWAWLGWAFIQRAGRGGGVVVLAVSAGDGVMRMRM
jgi:hypothetical protein